MAFIDLTVVNQRQCVKQRHCAHYLWFAGNAKWRIVVRMTSRLLTERQQAKQLQISPRHLYDLRQKRLVPFIKLGKSVRYDPEDVAQAIKKLTIREHGRV